MSFFGLHFIRLHPREFAVRFPPSSWTEGSMLNGIGLAEIMMLGLAVLVVVGWWKILSRVGYPGFLSLLLFVPIVNVVVFLLFAYLPWPIEDEREEAK
jgi:hypothetical protein